MKLRTSVYPRLTTSGVQLRQHQANVAAAKLRHQVAPIIILWACHEIVTYVQSSCSS